MPKDQQTNQGELRGCLLVPSFLPLVKHPLTLVYQALTRGPGGTGMLSPYLPVDRDAVQDAPAFQMTCPVLAA